LLRLVGVGLLVAVTVAAAESLGSKQHAGKIALRVTVSGSGTVQGPGKRLCRKRCRWAFRRGAVVVLRARPAAGHRFVGWRGACSGAAGCLVRLKRDRRINARFRLGEMNGLSSWNPHTRCVPVKTTIPEILGSQVGSTGGATEAGGAFSPHLKNPQRHLLDPPCFVGGEPTFVQIDGVVVSHKIGHPPDGDVTTNLTDPNRPDISNVNMKTIHVEIDTTWFGAGVAPEPFPPPGTKIDVQGFVFWDSGNETKPSHSYSGWELHPVSAWYRSTR
jgi:Divergent InlB B-repeat domain